MYTVVSLTIDLAGEPDTIDFTLVLVSRFTVFFFFIIVIDFLGRRLIVSLGVFLKKCAHVTHFDPVYSSNAPRYSAWRRIDVPHFSFLHHPFSSPLLSQSSSSGNPSLHGSMSSSADFSDDDDYSYKSGSASPAPGDTLPWNLPRHERYKRKIHGGSVLDPAERAVLRIAGEVQSVSLLSGYGMELFSSEGGRETAS